MAMLLLLLLLTTTTTPLLLPLLPLLLTTPFMALFGGYYSRVGRPTMATTYCVQ